MAKPQENRGSLQMEIGVLVHIFSKRVLKHPSGSSEMPFHCVGKEGKIGAPVKHV